jgi:hypothetical protein
VGLGRLDTGISGSNSAQGMDVYLRPCVLCCTVQVEALRRADPPFRVLPNIELIHNFRCNSELEQVTRPNPVC